MDISEQFPEDFQRCVSFHGHVCPGLAIGYAAAKAGSEALGVLPSKDEEVVAIVENDSCAVDAVQVLLGCTFGKGNLIFRDWGKQVFTFLDRRSGRAVRLSFIGSEGPEQEQRRALRTKLDSGTATDADRALWDELRNKMVLDLIANPATFFHIGQVEMEMPAEASIVSTKPCGICGEETIISRLEESDGIQMCKGCLAGRG